MRVATKVVALSLFLIALAPSVGCDPAPPPVPAASDPTGNDLVAGAMVVAEEAGGGYRLLKVLHVDDMPEPLGPELHLTAYEPKLATWEDGAKQLADKVTPRKLAYEHMVVRRVHFMKRGYRVLGNEPVTTEEQARWQRR